MGKKNGSGHTGKYPESICWHCAKACTRECSWSEDFTPVPGWTAVENHFKNDNRIGATYLVQSCQEFVRDRNERDPETLMTENCLMLIERLLKVTADDYECAQPGGPTQNMIEKFIRGRGASRLHMISDPDAVIQKLRQKSLDYQKRLAQIALERAKDQAVAVDDPDLPGDPDEGEDEIEEDEEA